MLLPWDPRSLLLVAWGLGRLALTRQEGLGVNLESPSCCPVFLRSRIWCALCDPRVESAPIRTFHGAPVGAAGEEDDGVASWQPEAILVGRLGSDGSLPSLGQALGDAPPDASRAPGASSQHSRGCLLCCSCLPCRSAGAHSGSTWLTVCSSPGKAMAYINVTFAR